MPHFLTLTACADLKCVQQLKSFSSLAYLFVFIMCFLIICYFCSLNIYIIFFSLLTCQDHHVYKGGDGLFSVPDTQELCRRLEEKIAHLTRMGNNLQQENQGMKLLACDNHFSMLASLS